MNYQTTGEVELAIARYYDWTKNYIVPNTTMFGYEIDLLIVSKSGYGTEVEIKVSKGDLRKDAKKYHHHFNHRIKYLWFAMPYTLMNCVDLVPERAGIYLVGENGVVNIHRQASVNKDAIKWDDKNIIKLLRLAAMRIWFHRNSIQK